MSAPHAIIFIIEFLERVKIVNYIITADMLTQSYSSLAFSHQEG